VNNSPWHLAKRELHAVLTSRNIWVGASAAGLVLGFAAPFGTQASLGLLSRLIYWIVVVQVTLLTGTLIASLLNPRVDRLPHRRWLGVTGVGVVIGICVSLEVLALNWLVFGLPPLKPRYALTLSANTLAISVILNLAATWLLQDSAPAAEADSAATDQSQLPPLLTRLALDKRGRIISLTVQDHYVEVTTAAGTEMLLMRFGDAMREAGAGVQIHRSHWVAEDAVARVERSGSAARLTTRDGRELPVSRTYVPALRARGLLP